jgi:anti-sigma regulatory factor (Ser/Thr protein kinase)
VISVQLPAEPSSARRAREFVREQLGEAYGREVTETVALLATELVTNAVLHARTPFRLGVHARSEVVRVWVEDTSTATPSRRNYQPGEATTGRGLVLVEALAESWGIEPIPTGKRVWCEVLLSGSELGKR